MRRTGACSYNRVARVFRTALLILSGNVGGSLLGLVRNLLIARLISVENYGIAATFAMAMSIVEMLSNIGLQQQIVQNRDGDDPRFQASLQGFHLLRGLIAGATLFLAAGWIAVFLGIPEIAWAYQVLAIIPVVRGLQHFDIHRFKRRMRFHVDVMSQLVPAGVALAVVWPAYLWLGDYRVMLVSIAAQVVTSVTITHLLCDRPYRLAFDRTIIAGAVRFGWPLLFNSMLMFLVLNGEKMIVGREMGMVDLGILAMGFTLTLTPTLVIGRFASSFFLPQLSAVQDDASAFNRLAMVTLQGVMASTLIFLAVIVLFGRPIVDLLLGADYAPLIPLMIWLAILQVVRVLKAGGSLVALARAQTSNTMLSNLPRIAMLPVIWIVAASDGSLLEVIWLATLGEGLGLLLSLALLRQRLRVPLRPFAVPLLAGSAAILAAAGVAWLGGGAPAPIWSGRAELAGFGLLLGAALWTLKPFWDYVRRREMTRLTDQVPPL
jgi:O-antigen/teichoic acid export membrane protein